MHLESQTSFFECSSLSNVPDSKRVPLKSNSHTHTLTRKLQIVLLGSPPSRRERPISTRAVHTDRDKKKVSFSFARFSLRVVVVLRLSRPKLQTRKRRRRRRERDKKELVFCLDFPPSCLKKSKKKKTRDDFRVSNMCISLGLLYLSLFSLSFFFSFLFTSREKLVCEK